ncbi:hypothetical protein BDP27DRAFT_1309515, partial [Rhodocollybia butyracea]
MGRRLRICCSLSWIHNLAATHRYHFHWKEERKKVRNAGRCPNFPRQHPVAAISSNAQPLLLLCPPFHNHSLLL